MYLVLARTSRKMGATAWSGSQSVQYYPRMHECPSCFMSSLVRHDIWELQHGLALNMFNTILTFMSVHRVSCPRSYVTKDGSYSMVWLFSSSLHRAKHAHKHTQSYTMIRLSFSKMRWGFGTLASHDCVSVGYCLYIVVIGFVTRNITIVIC